MTDGELHRLIVENPREGWRAFIEQYTPELVEIIRHCGLREHDEVMEVARRVKGEFSSLLEGIVERL